MSQEMSRAGRIQGWCPGCPDTRTVDYGALFWKKKHIFNSHVLAEQSASVIVKTKQELNHRFPIYAS